MFTSTSQFKKEVERMLYLINNGTNATDIWQAELDEDEFYDVLKYLLDEELATGYTVKRGAQGDLMISFQSPRLTYAGLEMNEQEEK